MVINRIEIPPLIPMWLPDWCSAACPSAGTQTWPHRRAKSGKRTVAGGQKKIGFMAWFMAWFMGGFRIWDMIDDCWGWLVIWFMLICDDLWWFVMICDDLRWFVMIYMIGIGLHWFDDASFVHVFIGTKVFYDWRKPLARCPPVMFVGLWPRLYN